MKKTRTVIIKEEIDCNSEEKTSRGAFQKKIPLVVVCTVVVVILGIMFLSRHPSEVQEPASTGTTVQQPAESQENAEALIAQLMQKAALEPGNVELQYQLGSFLISLKRDREGLQYLERAVELDSTNATAYDDIGVAYAHLGIYSEAAAAYGNALRIKPEYVEASYNLGSAYMQLGKLGEAIECFDRTLALDATFYRAYNNLGWVYAQQGNMDKAIEQYEAALKIKSDFTDAHLNLATIYNFRGDSIKAEEHIKATTLLK